MTSKAGGLKLSGYIYIAPKIEAFGIIGAAR
jgi:hypothetical protein